MQLQDAAKALLISIQAPKGAANVLPLMDGRTGHLVVWLDGNDWTLSNQIPARFAGYPVSVEVRPSSVAH